MHRPDDLQKTRLEELDARLAALPEAESSSVSGRRASKHDQDTSSFGLATRLSTDLLAAVGVCLFAAWWIAEWWLPQSRAMIMAFAGVLGIGVGIYTVWRTSQRHFATSPRVACDDEQGGENVDAPLDTLSQTVNNAKSTASKIPHSAP